MITVKKPFNVSIEICFFKTHRQKSVVKREKELGNIKCYDTYVILFQPTYMDEMSKVQSYISSGALSDVTQLIWAQEAIQCYVKLETVADYLFYEFTSSVEENYRLEGLRQVVGVLVRFGNDDYYGSFEIQWPEF